MKRVDYTHNTRRQIQEMMGIGSFLNPLPVTMWPRQEAIGQNWHYFQLSFFVCLLRVAVNSLLQLTNLWPSNSGSNWDLEMLLFLFFGSIFRPWSCSLLKTISDSLKCQSMALLNTMVSSRLDDQSLLRYFCTNL